MKQKLLLLLIILVATSCCSQHYHYRAKMTKKDRQVAGRMTGAGLMFRLSLNPKFP